jgi:DNA-binding response OmpR family regulator
MMRKRILVVDDSKTAAMMTSVILGRALYEVELAADGEEGVRKAMADQPDLILMDVVMPKMDGLEACRRLKDQDATRDIPVIMLTTRGEASNIQAGMESGCNDYLTKPVNSVELLAKVRDCLRD